MAIGCKKSVSSDEVNAPIDTALRLEAVFSQHRDYLRAHIARIGYARMYTSPRGKHVSRSNTALIPKLSEVLDFSGVSETFLVSAATCALST